MGLRPINKFIYKIMYTDEIIKCTQGKLGKDLKVGYNNDIPVSYEQYKK